MRLAIPAPHGHDAISDAEANDKTVTTPNELGDDVGGGLKKLQHSLDIHHPDVKGIPMRRRESKLKHVRSPHDDAVGTHCPLRLQTRQQVRDGTVGEQNGFAAVPRKFSLDGKTM